MLLFPAELERRRFAHRIFTARTNEKGSFSLNGVISGDYLAFAVPHADDGIYYDLEWPERNRERAVQLTVGPAASFTIALTLTPRQRDEAVRERSVAHRRHTSRQSPMNTHGRHPRIALAVLARAIDWRPLLVVRATGHGRAVASAGFLLFWRWKLRRSGRPRIPVPSRP